MPVCCVPGCDSGSCAEKKRSLQRCERPKALFCIPKDPIMFTKWKDAALCNKTSGNINKICELHFNKEDIITHNKTRMNDGKVIEIPRKCFKLKEGAVPLQCQPLIKLRDQMGDCSKERKCNDQGNCIDPSESPETKRIKLLDYNKQENNKNTSESNNNNSHDSSRYKFDNLEKDLTARLLPMPDGWAYNIQEKDFIKFVCVHPLKLTIHLIFFIYPNMNATVVFVDNNFTFNTTVNFHHMSDVYNYLKKLTDARKCEGTGIYDRYSDTCQKLIYPDGKNHKGKLVNYQCSDCQEFTAIIIAMQRHSDFRKSKITEMAH